MALFERAVVLLDVADAALRQQLQPPLHFARGVAQHVRRDLRVGDHRREQVRNVFVEAQFQALRVDQHQFQFVRRGLVEHAHQQGIEEHALAGAGRSGDQQVRHLRQIGGANAADQVLAERKRQLRRRMRELRRFDHLAQRDRFAVRVGHFDADRRFAGNALDQDRFGAQRQAQIVGQPGDAAVLDARFGLEFVGGDHRARD